MATARPTFSSSRASRSRPAQLDALGENFEKTAKGFIDFLLLDAKGFPLIVLEAKAEDKSPLVGKEQARKYAKSQNCRFVILSNGNLHYFWDLERGNPYIITTFPTPDVRHRLSEGRRRIRQRLIAEQVERRLHRPHPAPDVRHGGGLEERGRAARLHPRRTSSASSAPTS